MGLKCMAKKTKLQQNIHDEENAFFFGELSFFQSKGDPWA